MRNSVKLLSLSFLVLVSLLQATPALTADAVPLPATAIAPAAALPQPATLPELSPPAPSTVASPVAAAPAVQIKIGYVDINRAGKESKPGREAQARFKEKADKLQTRLASRQKQLEKQKSALQASLPSLSPEQRAARIKEYDNKVDDFKKSVQKAEKEMQPVQEELLSALSRKLEQAAASCGKANGLAAVLVKKDMLFQGSDVQMIDVTDEVIKLLDLQG